MIPELVRGAVSLFRASPAAATAALFGLCVAGALRLGVPKVLAYLGPFAVAYFLWRKRHSRLALALIAVVWALVLWAYPSMRVSVGIAIPLGLSLGGLVWLAQRYPQHPPLVALRYAVMEARQREVLTDAVPASAGTGARVLRDTVKVNADGSFEAEIVGPPGVAHADLLMMLGATLSETVYSLSGRRVEHMSVVGAGVKGGARVRGAASSPYEQPVGLDDL